MLTDDFFEAEKLSLTIENATAGQSPSSAAESTSPQEICRLIRCKPHVYRIYRIGRADHDCYVGSTTGKTNRAYYHTWHLRRNSHHSLHLQAAWNKYGSSAFRYQVLEISDETHLRNRERWWMTALAVPASTLPRYNCSEETNQPPHWTPTAATRIRWSQQRKGRRHSAEAKAKIAAAGRGRRHSEESLHKLRVAHRGCRPGEEALLLAKQAMRKRFTSRIQAANAWCASLGIECCFDGASLIFHIARSIANGHLRDGDKLPSVGSLAAALHLTVPTVSLVLRRRAPIVGGLTIVATGTGLIVANAADGQISQPLSFYALSTRDRISKVHRDRGIRPAQKCNDARRHAVSKREKRKREARES